MKIEELEKKVSLSFLVANDFKLKLIGSDTYRINPCPICGGKDHFTINAKNNYYSSFNGCCAGGSVYKYLQEVKGMSEIGAYEELNRLAGEPKKDVNPKPTKAEVTPLSDYTSIINKLYNNQTDQDKQYFIDRGLTPEIIDKYKLCIGDIKELNSKTYGKKAIIPIWKNGQAVFYNSRALEDNPKIKYIKAPGQATFLNIDYLKTVAKDEVIVITEGEFDALSLETIGVKAIAVGGTENYKRFMELNTRNDINILTAFDNDEPGQSHNGEYYIEIPQEYKDLNEWLKANISDFKASINEQIQAVMERIKEQLQGDKQAYKSMSVAGYIETFKNKIDESVNHAEIPTGFKDLDNILDGGLYEGLYIIGAISSLGKTSWLLQICDQIAQNGQDVLYFSLEMSKSELMAKSISRLTYLNAKNKSEAKTTRGILNGKKWADYSFFEIELINNCIDKYGDYADHLYISEGLGTIGVNAIKEAVERHIRITGNRPVLVIDYLQILAPYDIRATDKQNVDNAVFELKRISRDYKMPVVAISSLNRANYSTEINLAAFKESGAIEYSSDVLLGLQFQNQSEKDFDVDNEKSKEKREIEVKILKNRNGSTGKSINFEYHCLFNCFEETGAKEEKKINKRL